MTDKRDKFPINIDLESNDILVALAEIIGYGEETIIEKLIEKGLSEEEASERLILKLKEIRDRQVQKDGRIGSKNYLIISKKIQELEYKQGIDKQIKSVESLTRLSKYGPKEKIYLLYQLGVLEHLQSFGKNNNSANAIGNLLSPILNELPGTLQRHINGFLNEQTYEAPKTQQNLQNQLERLGFIKKRS